jgi:hypothetical protein
VVLNLRWWWMLEGWEFVLEAFSQEEAADANAPNKGRYTNTKASFGSCA